MVCYGSNANYRRNVEEHLSMLSVGYEFNSELP